VYNQLGEDLGRYGRAGYRVTSKPSLKPIPKGITYGPRSYKAAMGMRRGQYATVKRGKKKWRVKLPAMMTEAQAREHIRGIKGLGEYAEFEDLGKFKFKKIFKPIAKVAKKVAPVLAAVNPLTMPLTLFAPGVAKKLYGIKSAKAEKSFKIGRKITVGMAAVAGAVIAAPLIAPIAAKAGSVALGGLKFLGGKVVSMPSKLFSALKGKGYSNPGTASNEEILNTAQETGSITPGMLDQFSRQFPSGQEPYAEGGQLRIPGKEGEIAEAGMFAGMGGALPWIIGGGLLLLTLTGVARPVTLRGREW